MNRPLHWIWSTPRAVSTALERCMLNVPGLGVEHEPFTDCYYFGSERRSERYGRRPPAGAAGEAPAHDSAARPCEAREACRRLERRRETGPVLVKELAFQGEPYVPDSLLAATRSIVLLRRPRRVHASLVKLKPDFTDDEFGFDALLRVAERLAALSAPMLLVDGDELQRRPAETVSEVCRFLGLPFSTALLSWDDGRVRRWRPEERDSQAPWHATLERSRGLVRTAVRDVPVPPGRRALVRRAEAVHERLKAICARAPDRAEAV